VHCSGRWKSPGCDPRTAPWGGLLRVARLRQEFALNLSARRRLCNTVGARFTDDSARCCAISAARSRAAARTNLARSNQSLFLRSRFGGAKRSALVNIFMICPRLVGSCLADDKQILPRDPDHLMAIKPSNHAAADPQIPLTLSAL
jgi:hypothetical protein